MNPEIKIGICLGLVVLLAEGAARLGEPRLSKDLAHLATFQDLAEKMPEGNARFDVLLLGNSLARHGVGRSALEERLQAEQEAEVKMHSMLPDATGITEWNWGFRRYLEKRDGHPDLVLLFTGPKHLLDARSVFPERMGAYYVPRGDRWRYAMNELEGIDERSRFFLASVSRIFANRARLRPLVFYNLVPGYEATAQAINRGLNTSREELEAFSAQSEAGTSNLEALFSSVDSVGGKVVIVSVPVPGGTYSLPDSVREAAADHGCRLIELGSDLDLSDNEFPDGYHLGRNGAERFTEELVARLMEKGAGVP